MANSKDNISKYATSFISFDEASGNAYDNIGGYTGTIYNSPTRVTGWNNEGKAISLNGNQYVVLNRSLQNNSSFVVRCKIKTTDTRADIGRRFFNTTYNMNGIAIYTWNGIVGVEIFGANGGIYHNLNNTKNFVADGKWHDVCFSFDASKGYFKLVVDGKEENSLDKTEASFVNYFVHSDNITMGKETSSNAQHTYLGDIDSVEIYNQLISPIPDKHLVLHDNQHKYHNGSSWQATTNTEANFIQYGMNDLSHITEAHWSELQGDKSLVIWSDFEDKQYASVVLEKEPFTSKDLLGEEPELIYYTDSNKEQVAIKAETDPYSVYDHISETPEVVVYTDSTNDIAVSTTTEPFDLYDELSDEVEVLFYTDDESAKEADLILEANWSPLDELEGDIEVVTWTDEPQETAQRVLEMTAIPKPQFIKLVNPKRLYGYLDSVVANDISTSYRDEARYLLCGEDETKWFTWNDEENSFFLVDASSEELILKNGMKYTDLNKITDTQWRTWKGQYLNIGIFLKDNPRDTIVSVVDNVSYQDYLPRHSVEIEDTSLYILNTTAKIDIEFNGNLLKGVLSDEDLTRVQYRVLLNGKYHYPADGEFTQLTQAPTSIELMLNSKDIKMDDWNNIKVEFQDFFGTTDYWTTNFIGTYSGLMFKDTYGKYYSSEIGEVLQYLDFGIIIAGQTTIEHEILLKNQYGYNISNLTLSVDNSNFPDGMECQLSESLSPFSAKSEIDYGEMIMKPNDELSFFVRLKTELGVTPDSNGSFSIIARADRVQ